MNKTVSRVLWIVAGVLLIVAGGACMLHPGATLSGLSFLLGMAMLFSGVVDIIIFAIHDEYSRLITGSMSSEGLFEVLGNMLNELQDGHVNLASAHNVSYYDAWYQDYPRNFREDIVEDFYQIGRAHV